jgi:hypothetical protein
VVDGQGNGIPDINVYLDLGGDGISDENGYFTMPCAWSLASEGGYSGICYVGFFNWPDPDERMTIVVSKMLCDPENFPECC